MDVIPPDDGAVESWTAAIERFEKYLWPVFRKYGYSKEAAYLYWTLHRIETSLDDITGTMLGRRGNDDDGEEWRR